MCKLQPLNTTLEKWMTRATRERILVGHPDATTVASLEALLKSQGYEVLSAWTGQEVIRLADTREPDVVLLSMALTDVTSLSVCRNLRLRNSTWSIPIILMSTPGTPESELMKGLETGANDWVPGPESKLEVLGRVSVMLRMKRVEDKLRRLYVERTRELEWSNMELQKIRTQLILKNQMSTLGMMVAVAAHEIRSPSSSITGNIELTQSLLQELADSLAQLPAIFDSGPPEDRHTAYQLMREMARELGTNPPLDLASRRKEVRRIEAELETRDYRPYSPELTQNIARMRLGSTEHLDLLVPLLKRHGEDFLPALFKLGDLIVMAKNMRISIDRINAIVSSMKAYSHIDRENSPELNIHEGLDDTLTIMSYIFKGGVEVHRHYASELPRVAGHAGELNQVWTNILQNAWDAMDGRGEIHVNTSTRYVDEIPYVAVAISDNGRGIPPDVLPHIFDSFFTTKEKGEGSGLGLDICKRIIETHKGMVEVESKPGATTLTVLLPVSQRVEKG